jgi:hypothetical protein
VEVQIGFADCAEVETAGKTLGGERVTEKSGKLAVQADGEQKREEEIEGVGPQERGKTAQGEGESMDEDVSAFKHECGTSSEWQWQER